MLGKCEIHPCAPNETDHEYLPQTELGAILTKEQGKPKGEAEGEVGSKSSKSFFRLI